MADELVRQVEIQNRHIKDLEEERDALMRFKNFVHGWLTAKGVPYDPDPEHTNATDCRISGRLAWLWDRHRAEELDELLRENIELKALKVAYEKTPKQWSTAQAPTLEALLHTAGCITAQQRAEERLEKLRQAVHKAGFGIMETSGKWSIHDLSEKAQAESDQEVATINRNIDLEVLVKQLAQALRPFVKLVNGVPDNWPPEVVLELRERGDGSLYLSYRRQDEEYPCPSIGDYRTAAAAMAAARASGVAVDKE